MNMKHTEIWEQMRTAYQPAAPTLDTAAIMNAVRREAAARPWRRADPGLAGQIPGWICTAAAVLAIFATGFVLGRSVSVADRTIGMAWTKTVPPEEFAQSFLTFEEAGADLGL